MPDEVTPRTMPIPDSPLQAVAAWLRKIEGPLALLVVIVIVGVAAPCWNVPLSRDQGVYATCADVLLSGGVPYRDCWDTKGPMLHYTYALAKLIFGVNSSGPYILNALAIAATALILAALAYRWIGRLRLAYAVGLLYGLLAIIVRFDMNAQPESFANFFTMLGLLGITVGTQKGRRWLFPASGVVLALAVLYKYALLLPFGVAALALVFGVPLSAPQKPLRKRLENFGLTLAGSLGVVLVFGLYLLLAGALDDALLHVRFILFYFPRAQLNPDEYAIRSLPLQQTLLYFGRLPVVFGLAFVGCAAAVWRRRWYGLPLILYVLAGVAVVWGQQRFTPYHWTASLPALSLAIGALAYEILNFPPLSAPAQNAILGVMAAGLAVNVGTFFYVDQWLILGDYLTGREDAETFFETQGVWDQMVAADYIRERTDPDDPIWVWGHHTAIYYLAQRHSPTRFIYNEPLLMHIRGGHPWKEAWRAEALEDIYRDPPVYILLTTFDRTFFDFQNPNDSWRDIPEYSGFTARYYLKEYEFGR
ncbi:MAG: glycosyltransferase family 39 protein, partial [Chloroflexota bacterium]